MGTIYAMALAIVATATGLLALAEAIAGSVEPGVVADDSGGIVRSVAPGGFAWRNGIRVGQTVVSLGAVDQPAGWRIVTMDGAVERRSSLAVATGTLRSSWPVGVAAVVLGGLALAALPTRRRRAELAADGHRFYGDRADAAARRDVEGRWARARSSKTRISEGAPRCSRQPGGGVGPVCQGVISRLEPGAIPATL